MLNQRTDESDVIDVVDRGVRTARSGIPGKQPLVEASRTVRIDDHKRFAIRECVHERVFFFVFSVSAAAVKVKNDWNIAHLNCSCRHVHNSAALTAAEIEAYVMVAGRKCLRGLGGIDRDEPG